MGIVAKVDLSSNPIIAMETGVRRGLLAAGAKILALSDTKAPTEPDPRHGEHLTETGFVRATVIDGVDYVIVGYGAFWAGWQEVHEDWNHPYGGEAKFLELSVIEGEPMFLETVAASVRAELK